MNDKEILKLSIERLAEQGKTINKSLIELKNKYFKYEVEELKAKYQNTFWIYKNNCYSCPQSSEDYWDVYYFVRNVDEDGIIELLEFSINKDFELTIKEEKTSSCCFNNYEAITKEEFLTKWEEAMGLIDIYKSIFE